MQLHREKALGITSVKLPFSNLLIVEASDGDLYMVDSTNQDVLLKSTKARLLIDGSDWTTIATRDNEIRALWYDRTNEYIYLLDCDNTNLNNDIDVAYIDLSDDSVNDLGTKNFAGATMRAYDIFIISTTVYMLIHQEGPAINNIKVYSVDDPGFTLIDSVLSNAPELTTHVIISSGIAYHIVKITGLAGIDILDFDPPNYGSIHGTGAGFNLCVDANLRGIAYDGSDILYFVLKDTDDNKNYLCTYGITGDTFTQLSEYNIALMLDRNCSNTVPNLMEKAFGIANKIVYQIKPRKGGLYQLQNLSGELANDIIAITDNFLMDSGGVMYEYVNASDYVEDVRIKDGIFPIRKVGSFMTHPDNENLFEKGDTIEIFDDSDNREFLGLITDKNRSLDGLYRYALDSYFNEAHALNYAKSFSSDKSSEKIQDVIDNSFDHIYRSSSIIATALDYDYSLNRQSAALLNMIRFLEREVISIGAGGLMKTEAYDGLTKAPQYYLATYGFRGDDIGDEPAGWTSSNGANCTTTIIASLDGHKKVLQLYDNNGATQCEIYIDFSSAQTDGIVEVWHRTTDASKRSYIVLLNQSDDYSVQIYFDNTNVYSWDGGASHDHGDFAANIWYHYRIIFDCATDTFDLYQDGVLLDAGIDFNNNAITLDRILLRTYYADSGYYAYYDAIGCSWDANYNVGDNEVAWDVSSHHQNVMLINAKDIKSGYYKGSLGITRASVRMAGNVIRTKPDNRAETEQVRGVIPLKEYRDLKLVANAEADQLATNLFNIFSLETEFIALRVQGEGFLPPGQTLDIRNTGSILIAQTHFCIISFIRDPKYDVYLQMIVSNNIVLPSEFTSNFDTSPLQIHQANLQTFENATDIAELIALPTWPTSGTAMTVDAAWHDVDVSGTYGAKRHLVLLYIVMYDTISGQNVTIRPKGSADITTALVHQVANNAFGAFATVQTDPDGVWQYKCEAGLSWAQYRILAVLTP